MLGGRLERYHLMRAFVDEEQRGRLPQLVGQAAVAASAIADCWRCSRRRSADSSSPGESFASATGTVRSAFFRSTRNA